MHNTNTGTNMLSRFIGRFFGPSDPKVDVSAQKATDPSLADLCSDLSAAPDDESLKVMEEWVFLNSKDMELAMKQVKTARKQRKREIDKLQKRLSRDLGSVSRISQFAEIARVLIDGLLPEQKASLTASRLPAPQRAAIVRDALSASSETLLLGLATHSELRDNTAKFLAVQKEWKEEKYAKNSMGEIASLMWQASERASFDGLTQRILGEMLFAGHLSLGRIVQPFFSSLKPSNREARLSAMNLFICDILQEKIGPELIRLWLLTSRVSKVGLQNQGKVLARWESQANLAKEKGPPVIAARFLDKQNKCTTPGSIITHNEMQRRRGFLERSLSIGQLIK